MPTFKPVIFVSYAHEDSRWFEKGSLMSRLIPSLERVNAEIWYDKRIGGADLWRDEIEKAIDKADIAVLLVSQFFLNSDFIMRVELPRMAKRAEAKQLVIFPILVGYCEWESIEAVSRPQMMPGEPTPLVEYLEPLAKWERVQYEILQALLRQIGKIREEREKLERVSGLKGGAKPPPDPVIPEPENVDTPPSPSRERSGWFDRIGNLLSLGLKKSSALAATEVALSKDGSKSTGQGSIPTETTARIQQVRDETSEATGGSASGAKPQPHAPKDKPPVPGADKQTITTEIRKPAIGPNAGDVVQLGDVPATTISGPIVVASRTNSIADLPIISGSISPVRMTAFRSLPLPTPRSIEGPLKTVSPSQTDPSASPPGFAAVKMEVLARHAVPSPSAASHVLDSARTATPRFLHAQISSVRQIGTQADRSPTVADSGAPPAATPLSPRFVGATIAVKGSHDHV